MAASEGLPVTTVHSRISRISSLRCVKQEGSMKLAYELSRWAGLGIVMAFLLSGAGHAADVTIRFSTAAPPSDFLAKSLDSFKTEVEVANIGVKVETHPASTLFRQGTEVPALQRANLEMSTMTTFEVAQQIPDYGMFNRAYLFRDYDHLRRVFDGPIGEGYRRAVADKMGIEVLAVAYLGTRQVNLRQKRSVKGPTDLAGIKMRMPAGPEWLLLGKALGVSPVPLGMLSRRLMRWCLLSQSTAQ
jgi:TRAP-type C4-dicarboxylate transport system substrate-binding protein